MKKVLCISTVMLLLTSITGIYAIEENIAKQENINEIAITTGDSLKSQNDIVEKKIVTKSVKLSNNNTMTSLPVNAEFWEAGVQYKVLGEGKVSIYDTNGFVSQSSNPKVLQVDSVTHDGETYLITQVVNLNTVGYETIIMNNIDTFLNQPMGSWDIGGIKGVFPNITTISRDDFMYLVDCFHTLEMENVAVLPDQMFYRFGKLKEVSLPKVTTVEGSYTFVETPIEKVNMPSLLTVAERMFYECNSLKSISLPAVKEVASLGFYKANALESVDLPSVKKIGQNAFRALSNLKEINIKEVEELGNNAFAGTNPVNGVTEDSFSNKLTSLFLPKLKKAGDSVFNGNIYLTNIYVPQLVEAGNYAFYRAGKSTEGMSITANALEKIGNNSFAESGITKATLPNVKEVSYSAFTQTKKLESLELPQVTHIKDSAISLSTIKNIYLPKVEVIEANAFRESTKLETVISPVLKTIGNSAFYVKDTGSSSLKNIDLDNVESIGAAAFRYCKEVREVELPKVTSIGIVAFGNCIHLETFKAPVLERLSERALADNTSLKTVALPNVKTIGYCAMLNCTSLESLTLENIQTMEDEAFAISVEGKTRSFEKLYLKDQLPPVVQIKDAKTTLAFLNQKTPRYIYVNNAEAYRLVDDGNINDNLWYGWTIVQFYQVEAEIIKGKGTITPSVQEVEAGKNVVFTLNIEEGWELESIISNASHTIQCKGNEITVYNVKASQKISISLKEVSIEPETPISPEIPSNTNQPSSKVVETGDSLHLTSYFGAVFVSVVAMIFVIMKKEK